MALDALARLGSEEAELAEIAVRRDALFEQLGIVAIPDRRSKA